MLDRPSETTEPHTQLLRCALEIEESVAYLRVVAPGETEPDLSRVWPDKSPARLPLLRRQMDRRFAAYPHAHEALHQWAPTMPSNVSALVCHWHLQLADPIYRAFTALLRTVNAISLHTVSDDFLEPYDTSGWSAATRLQLASKLLSCALEAGLVSGNRGDRVVMTPFVPKVAVAYLAHLLGGVQYEGTILDNPYVASVGLTKNDLGGVKLSRKNAVSSKGFEPRMYPIEIPMPVGLDTDRIRVVDLPLRSRVLAAAETLPEEAAHVVDAIVTREPVRVTAPPVIVAATPADAGMEERIAALVVERMKQGLWEANERKPEKVMTPSDSWFSFFTEKMVTIGTKPARVSTYRSAYADYISRCGGPAWPSPKRIAVFAKFCRDRLSGAYARGRVLVIEEWRQWSLDRNLFDPDEADADVKSIAPDFGVDPSTTSLAGAVMRINASEVEAIAEATKEKIAGALWGGEASEDYWATITRHVISRYGTDAIASKCRIDKSTAEEYVRLRKFPAFARPFIEELYSNILLRRRRLAGHAIDDIVDEVDDLDHHITRQRPEAET